METFLALVNASCVLVADNPLAVALPVGVVALLVWTLVALVAHSKISQLRNQISEENQAKSRLKHQLDSTEQRAGQLQNQLQQSSDNLALIEKEKQKESDYAAILAQQIALHRQQLHDSSVLFAQACNETLSHTENSDSTALWQQHSQLRERVLENLRAHHLRQQTLEQSLSAAEQQLSEQNAAVERLQQALASQTVENSRLTVQLETQQNHQALIAQLEQQLKETQTALTAQQQLLEQSEALAKSAERLPPVITTPEPAPSVSEPPVIDVAPQTPAQTEPAPTAPSTPSNTQFSAMRDLFTSKKQPSPAASVVSEPVSEPVVVAVTEALKEPVIETPVTAPPVLAEELSEVSIERDISIKDTNPPRVGEELQQIKGQLKGLYGLFTQKKANPSKKASPEVSAPVIAEPKVITPPPPIVEPVVLGVEADIAQEPVERDITITEMNVPSVSEELQQINQQLKGLYGKTLGLFKKS